MVLLLSVTYLSIEKDIYDRIPACSTKMIRSMNCDVNINIQSIIRRSVSTFLITFTFSPKLILALKGQVKQNCGETTSKYKLMRMESNKH